MDCRLIPAHCQPTYKKRKLSYEVNDNAPAMEEIAVAGYRRWFLTIPQSSHVFQTEEWQATGSALFLPVHDDLLVNIRNVEQISCADGHYFVADNAGKYSKTISGKVIHLWRYDKTQRKLYISRSFLFTSIQEFVAVQQFLQQL